MTAPMTRMGGALIIALIVATIFNDLPPFFPVGELSKDAFVYLFPVALLYFLPMSGRLTVPTWPILILIALLIAMITSVVVNFSDISTAYYKGRSGMSRVITQAMSIGFGSMVALLFYNFSQWGYLPKITRGAEIALMIMAGIAAIEIASWLPLPGLTPIYDAFFAILHDESSDFYPLRLRLGAFEASWAAVMMTFIFPFAITACGPRKLVVFLGLVAVMMILAQSRTALLVIGIQFLVFLWAYFRHRKDYVVHAITLTGMAFLLMMVIPQVQQKVSLKLANLIEFGSVNGLIDPSGGDENVSNVTRLAAIRAGMSMFHDKPVLGVGLGQYGFNYRYHIRAEDLRSWEVRSYSMAADQSQAWPPTYSLHVRMLAETGLIGYLLWLALIVPVLIGCLRHAGRKDDAARLNLAVAMTLIGWILLGASIDSFRFFGGWIALGVGFALRRRAI